ncbi:MAG TPA: hypothetical protein P5262_01465 [Candidatus Moranbacteria bacterium]|nr:hypothetical protein [Candidatus Moranbacteria bacterium]
METEIQSIIPNTTQIPHLIIRRWMPLLGDVELRILLVVADQTLGWIEDPETKRRKEKDWISQSQLMKKINRSDRAIQNSLKRLVDELRIIQAHDEWGNLLDSPQKRMKCGGKIFYRLSLKHPEQTTLEESSGVGKLVGAPGSYPQPPKILRAKNFRATKETGFTKKSYRTSKLARNKKTIPSRYFLWKFGQLCQAIRKTKPVLVKYKDGNLLKLALEHLTEFQLELELVWFLENKKEMSPSLGAALCREVIRDFIKAGSRQYGFYGNLERTALRYNGRKNSNTGNESEKMNAMVEALKKLKKAMVISRDKNT